jgi:hypothetical protein
MDIKNYKILKSTETKDIYIREYEYDKIIQKMKYNINEYGITTNSPPKILEGCTAFYFYTINEKIKGIDIDQFIMYNIPFKIIKKIKKDDKDKEENDPVDPHIFSTDFV